MHLKNTIKHINIILNEKTQRGNKTKNEKYYERKESMRK